MISYVKEGASGLDVIPLESKLLSERKLFLYGPITPEMSIQVTQAMLYLTKTKEPISVYINSPGGEVNAGLVIYDLFTSCKNELRLFCVGQAFSMAAVLLSAGQKSRRFILPHSRVMIHEVLINGGVAGSATSISRISEAIQDTKCIVNEILAKHTGRTREEIERATAYDNLMSAEEAIEFGICDEIRTSLE